METKPYFWHSLRVTTPGSKSRSFRKVTRSSKFPELLCNIARAAFDANRLFEAGLLVEHGSCELPKDKVIPVEAEPHINDENYVEADPLDIPEMTFNSECASRLDIFPIQP